VKDFEGRQDRKPRSPYEGSSDIRESCVILPAYYRWRKATSLQLFRYTGVTLPLIAEIIPSSLPSHHGDGLCGGTDSSLTPSTHRSDRTASFRIRDVGPFVVGSDTSSAEVKPDWPLIPVFCEKIPNRDLHLRTKRSHSTNRRRGRQHNGRVALSRARVAPSSRCPER